MPIILDRSICCDFNETISREWLITNGLGGYAAGTVAGTLARMQHGLLVAPLHDEAIPHVLLAKIDEEVVFDQRTYYLGTNEYQDGTLNPAGFVHLETFHLEEGFPVFTYRVGGIHGITLEKRIWMPQGLHTTYIQYRVLRAMPQERAYNHRTPGNGRMQGNSFLQDTSSYGYGRNNGRPQEFAATEPSALTLTLLPFTSYRPYDKPQYGNLDWQFSLQMHAPEAGDEVDSSGLSQRAGESAVGAINRPLQLPRGVIGCTIRAWEGAVPFSIFVVGHPESETTFLPTGVWYWHFLRRQEQAAGLTAIDDLYLPGVIKTKLWPGEDATLTIIATTEELSSLTFDTGQIARSRTSAVERARSFLQPQRYFGEGGETAQTLPVLPFAASREAQIDGEEFLRLLLQAGDRFIAQRALPRDNEFGNNSAFFSNTEHVPVIVPGYYDLHASTREALIALPGLTLATRRYSDARRILRSLARHFRYGLLPDHLPTRAAPLTEQDYGSVDTALWYFYALDSYLRLTRDHQLLDDLYTRLADCISAYTRGTSNGIRVDSGDGLLQAHSTGKALTWMNAMDNGEPVTPRYGKPVEVNALWYNALRLMDEWTHWLFSLGRLSHTTDFYIEESTRCKHSFNRRFQYALGGYLYDVIDGPEGDDTRFRPNQLLALSLRYPVLDTSFARLVMGLVTERLLTPFGLRTLAPDEAGYAAQIPANAREQQQALHQGSVWPWLVGPYVDAMLHLEQSSEDTGSRKEQTWHKGLHALQSFRRQLDHGMLGMIGNIYDGDAKENSETHGTQLVASALSTGELLRVYKLLAQTGMRHLDTAFSV
ncbi:MAG TPA: amylo-alpha-1,6-glucosidase [Ktedonobacteraceae bacterium]|nr:amylo-alpha-1,6-glucosidase [Ktedonobacteraceae bacterium]